MVTIDSGKVEASNKFREVPKSKWESLVQVKRDFLAVRINYDCRCLIEFCEEAEEVYAELGYASSEEMIREGYELDPSQIELAVAWLNTNGMERPVPLAEAIAKVEAMAELPEHGEIGKGRVRVDNINSKVKGGTDTEYTLRRLKRDAPELLEAIKRGELSVNAAAIKAGIRKRPSQAEICVKAFRKADDKLAILEQMIDTLDPDDKLRLLGSMQRKVCCGKNSTTYR
jgi:hypothetical protein